MQVVWRSKKVSPQLRWENAPKLDRLVAAEDYNFIIECRAKAAAAVEAFFDKMRIDALYGPEIIGDIPIIDSNRGIDFEGALSSLTGLPEIVLQGGFDDRGMPFGFGLIGRRHADGDLIAMGYAYEQLTSHRRTPAGFP